MRGAKSYARIILGLTEDDLDMVRRNEAFDDIVLWLAGWRAHTLVDRAYRRLIGRSN
jgi:hypothetical protein